MAKAREKGITTIDDFARLSVPEVGGLYSTPKEARDNFLLNCSKAIKHNTHHKLNGTPGEFTNHKTYMFMDIEDSGYVHPSIPHFVFLIGITVITDGKVSYDSFTCLKESDEQKIFEAYFDYVNSFDDPVVFYWSSKESSEFRKFFADRYGGTKYSVSSFEANSIDMLPAIKETVALSVQSYSIKDVAKFMGFQWRQEDVDANESLVLFWECYEEGITDVSDQRIKKIVDYNEDDCDALKHIYRWIQSNL